MSLDSLFQDRHTPAKPVRPTIRRRLLGRGQRLRTLGLAAGLLSLGLTIGQPAHAGTKNWDGSVADWYSDPNHWMPTGFPQPGDDARNTFTNAAMTLGNDASVNSFISNSAFTLLGGTFSGSTGVAGADTPNLHTLQVNNIFTLNGGTINNFTIAAGSQQGGQPAPTVIFTTSGGNALSNTVVNATLDLSTNSNAYLRLFNADTINGNISLGAGGGNGLHLYNSATVLTLNGTLTGFGSVVEDNGSSTFTNNNTINANNAANALTLGVTNFNNSAGATTEATGVGGVLNLSNTTTTNDGLLAATGGGTLNLTAGTTLQSNADGHINSVGGTVNVQGAALLGTINGVGASTLVFNTDGRNAFSNTTANINLDLTSGGTGYLRLFNADTINGNISLGAGGGNGLHLYNSATVLTLNGTLTGFGSVVEDNGSSTFTNNGTINANNAAGLVLGVTTFNNSAGATTEATGVGSVLNLSNTTTTNDGLLAATGGGTLNLTAGTTLQSNADGHINSVGGTVNVQGAALLGTINGVGASSLVFNTDGRNAFSGTTANINLDLATIPNAYLRLFNMDTINSSINLGESTSGNGLHLYNSSSNLVISSTGNLSGFGYVVEDNGNSTVTNNGTINANNSGNTIVTGVTNFNNNVGATTEATNGGVLNLSNTFTTNNGAVAATGGGVINLTAGTTFIGNAGSTINTVGGTFNVQGASLLGTLNGVGASSLVFNTDGRNAFDNTTANINLDLTTIPNAYLRLFDTDTINGAISLGESTSGNGLHLYNSATNLVINGGLTGYGFVVEDNGNSTVTNNSTINANNAAGLVLGVTTFNNNKTLEATNGGALALSNTFTTNSGALNAIGTGSTVTLTNGATFTGSGSAGSGNLITASGGGKVVVDGVNLRGTINTAAGTALILTTNGNNNLDNTTVNGNLDLATNNNAYLRLFDTDTINGAISLGEGPASDGLHLYNSSSNLVISSTGNLSGFGYVVEDNGNSTVTNNGTINANNAANPLITGVTNFTNSAGATTEATGGGALNLSNTFTTNSGALNAIGMGSTVTLTNGTTFTGSGSAGSGNLITASGGGKVVVDGVNLRGTINTAAGTALILTTNSNNNLDNTTVNGNLDLATNNNAYLRVFDTGTVNGNISLGEGPASDGLHLFNSASNLVIGSTGTLQGFGYVTEDNGGSTVTNGGLINANVSGQTLNINNTNFTNRSTGTAEATNGGTLTVTSPNATNSGTVTVLGGATANFTSGLTQTAGFTQVFGTLNANEAVQGGLFGGAGTVNGNVTNTGGTVQSVGNNAGGSLLISGNFTQTAGGTLDAFFGNSFHNLLTVTGQTTTGGTLGVFDLDFIPPAGVAAAGSKFAFLDYSGTLTPDGSLVNGFTQYFTNEVPDSNTSGKVVGANGFTFELTNDTVNKMLDLTVLTVGSPVPEASTPVSLGLLLALGLGGVVVASKRRKKA